MQLQDKELKIRSNYQRALSWRKIKQEQGRLVTVMITTVARIRRSVVRSTRSKAWS